MGKSSNSQPSKSSTNRKRKNTDPGSDLSKISRSQCSTMQDGQSSCSTTTSKITNESFLIDQITTDANNTTNVDKLCGKCRSPVIIDMVHVSSLKCCLCDVLYHGNCLDLNPVLISFLHVVSDIGGWCCVECRSSNKVNKPVVKPTKSTAIEKHKQ